MSIFPLPVFEEDADPDQRDALTLEERHALLEPPKTIVVRFGRMGMVGEYRSGNDIRPGCGSKLVARTHRGVEMTEMLTTTCTNAGCGKSVTRQEMRDYIENSGGKDFPFHNQGEILRLATAEDMAMAFRQREATNARIHRVKEIAAFYKLEMTIIDVELVLSADHLTVFYMAEDRVDFRELVSDLAAEYTCRVDMQQVGARDEARLTADYEKCGQHCCCKNFLKVLKPVSMRTAKQQKATLDPLKISGRCGRLMCCLRYEDQTYQELKANLPHRKTRVGTIEGAGLVIDGKILTQLVLVELEHDKRRIAVPLEELMDPEECPDPLDPVAQREAELRIDPLHDKNPSELPSSGASRKRRRRRRKKKSGDARSGAQATHTEHVREGKEGTTPKKKRRQRRRRRKKKGSDG